MKLILSEKLPRILNHKETLERELDVKITNRGKEVFVEGTPENEYIAEKVIDALNFGFPLEDALSIKDEESIFEIINIKDVTTRKDLDRVKSRLIGTKGKALRTLCNLTKCSFEIKENKIGIIGNSEYIQNAQDAVTSIIKGTTHGNVYARLEKLQPKEIVDLGLKEEKKKK